jgi:hypothetical protein
MAGSGRRLVLEGAFLVGLAVAAGLAEFSTQEIIEIMALGWIVTVLIELVAWRLSLRRPVVEQEPAVVPAPAPVVTAAPQPEPAAAAAEPDAEPEPEPKPEPEPVAEAEAAAHAEEEAGGLRMTEPKRGGLFGWKRKEAPGEITDETPGPPRHVRLIERPSGEDQEHDPADDHDAPPAERKGA